MSKKRWIIATGTGIWVLVLLGYLTIMPHSGSLVIGSVHGLEVMGQAASRGGPARFLSDGTTATIQLGTQTAHVTSKEIHVSSGRSLDVPVGCKKVKLFETRNEIRVVFDHSEHQ